MLSSPSRFILPLLLAAAPAAAQSVVNFTPDEPIDWPANITGSLTRCVIGEFTGDGVRDVFALVGSQPTLIVNPDSAGWMQKFVQGTNVNDLDVRPRAPGQGHDQLAFVNTAGLQLLEPHVGNGPSFVSVVEAGPWVSARTVRVGDVNKDGLLDYVGVGSDGKTLLIRLGAASGASTTSVTLPSTTGELVLLDWDGGSSLEIGAITYAGVELRNSAGALLWSHANANGRGDAITRTRPNGSSLDALAWVRKRATGGTQELLVFEYSGSPSTPTVRTTDLSSTWGGTNVFGVASSSVLGDSTVVGGTVENSSDTDLDLVTFDKSSYAPRFFLNTSPTLFSGAYFDAAASMRLSLPFFTMPLPDANAARPAFGDLDSDGRSDLLVPVQSAGLCLLRGQPPGSIYQPFFGAETFKAVEKLTAEESGAPGNLRTFRLTLSQNGLMDGSVAYTHLNVIAWHQNYGDNVLTAECNYLYVLPSYVPTGIDLQPKLEIGSMLGSGESFRSLAGTGAPVLQDRYWFEVRAVIATVDAQGVGTITDAGASFVAYLNYDPSTYCATAGNGWHSFSVLLPATEPASYNTTLPSPSPTGCPPRPIEFPIIKTHRRLPPPTTSGNPPSAGTPVLNNNM